MIPGIADTQGGVGTKGLLPLEAPLLILRRVGLIVRDADARRNEERICFLDCARVCPAAKPFTNAAVKVVAPDLVM